MKDFCPQLCIVILFVLFRSTESRSDDPVVSLDTGLVRGFQYTLEHLSAQGEAFLGIPFARPPVGSRRFLYPEPADPWSGILNATKLPNSCYQVPDLFYGQDFYGSNMWNPNTPVSEDCLYLNVWIPKTESREEEHRGDKLLPVMVWIFGGGFYSGTSTLNVYDGRILASVNDVIVVSVGYRVGALGFLCLDDPSVPCNAGLFDQLMALDWVQRNIRRFGGDPRNVTLFGESAGGASVSLHLLSPLSQNKFARAILQSGTGNMPWATTTLTEAKRRSVELAVSYLGCTNTDNMRILANCMRSKDAAVIVEHQWVSRGILQFPFLPVVDGYFLAEEPSLALQHKRFKKCPIMIGSNRNEGFPFVAYELPDQLSLKSQSMSRSDFLSSLKQFFYYTQYGYQVNSSVVLDAIIFHYTNWTDLNSTESNVQALESSIGDSFFVCPLNQFSLSYASEGLPVYSYYFNHRYQSNPWPDWMGVMHGDEIIFVFGQVLQQNLEFTEMDKQLSRLMMHYWTNFARTGSPNHSSRVQRQLPRWPIHVEGSSEYLELSDSLFQHPSIGRGPRIEHCAFWDYYVPKLIATTVRNEKKENDWKSKLSEGTMEYSVNWKTQFDVFTERNKDQCPVRR